MQSTWALTTLGMPFSIGKESGAPDNHDMNI